MSNSSETYKQLSSSVNFLDPIVRKDPKINKSPVVKINYPEKIKYPQDGINKNEYESTRVDGPKVPIVRVDMMVYKQEAIKYVYIDYDDFVPSCKVIIKQENKSMELLQSSTMNSNMTIVMVPTLDGQYKPISVDFYIKKTEYRDDEITFYGVYKMPALEQKLTKQIKSKASSNKTPTTYEFLEEIAVNECGLGFAATDNVKDINDEKTRLIRNESYKEAIPKHVAFGGLGKDSVFDCWIDLYRYLVVVNFSWIMQSKLTLNDIGINPVLGYNWDQSTMGNDTHQGMRQRIITNFKKLPGNSDIVIRSWKWQSDNSAVYDEGTDNDFIVGGPSTVGNGNDSLNKTPMAIKESSLDANINNFEFKKETFAGYEYGDIEEHNTPVLVQKNIHDMVFRKFRSKRLEVTMKKPNFGIQRGTVLNVVIFEYSLYGKQQIWKYLDGLKGDIDFDSNKEDKESNELLIDSNVPLPNISVSGYYYVDGMSFEYDYKNKEVTQKLFLIKKGSTTNYLNKASVVSMLKSILNSKDDDIKQ